MSKARQVICALDTSNVEEAKSVIKKLAPYVGAFKIGHAMTLSHGLDVVPQLQDAGAEKIFLDLKFHDIPNSVAVAVREAAKRQVWMMTVHLSGGPAMLIAAMEEAKAVDHPPLVVGVSVLTSLDQGFLSDDLGVSRTVEAQMVHLSQMGMRCDIDGVVCSPQEVALLRKSIGPSGVIVTPGIRQKNGPVHDQARVGTAAQALSDGADYLVIGRALTESADPAAALSELNPLFTLV